MYVSDRGWYLAAVILYGICTVYSIFLYRKGFRRDDRINYGLLLVAFCLHTVAMVQRGFSLDRCPISNLYEALIFITWTIVAAYLPIGAWPRLRFLGVFAAPILFAVGVFALMPGLDVKSTVPNLTRGWSSLHKSLILLAYGAFGLSSVAALMYLTHEHDLKFHKLRAVFSLLPPIQRLERAVGRLLVVGFALLSAGLVVSSVYLKRTRRGLPETGRPVVVLPAGLGALSGPAHPALGFCPAGTEDGLGECRCVCLHYAHLLGGLPPLSAA